MTKPDKTKKIQERNRTRPTSYDRLGHWFKAHARWVLLGIVGIGLIAGILSFDVKPSIDGDDTSYVLSAMRIVTTGEVPIGFRTPGYPIVLALFVWIFGVHLILLKATSLLFFSQSLFLSILCSVNAFSHRFSIHSYCALPSMHRC